MTLAFCVDLHQPGGARHFDGAFISAIRPPPTEVTLPGEAMDHG